MRHPGAEGSVAYGTPRSGEVQLGSELRETLEGSFRGLRAKGFRAFVQRRLRHHNAASQNPYEAMYDMLVCMYIYIYMYIYNIANISYKYTENNIIQAPVFGGSHIYVLCSFVHI